MNKISLIFIFVAFLLLPLEAIEYNFISQIELVLCSLLIGTFGIAHGAIDNHLYGVTGKKEDRLFIIVYIFTGLLFGFLWYFSFDTAFILFLLISAYHFGQSQFIDVTNKVNLLDRICYTLWGITLLSAFVYLNEKELLIAESQDYLSFSTFSWMIHLAPYLLVTSGSILIILLAYFIKLHKISVERGLSELYQLFIIGVVFMVASPLLGFTLYFVILHSIRVMTHEYQFFSSKNSPFSLLKFSKLLFPFTMLSIVGLLIFLAVVTYFQLAISLPLVVLVFISCLTLPHALVMDFFYQKAISQIKFL